MIRFSYFKVLISVSVWALLALGQGSLAQSTDDTINQSLNQDGTTQGISTH